MYILNLLRISAQIWNKNSKGQMVKVLWYSRAIEEVDLGPYYPI
jgi:hypothetical protein